MKRWIVLNREEFTVSTHFTQYYRPIHDDSNSKSYSVKTKRMNDLGLTWGISIDIQNLVWMIN